MVPRLTRGWERSSEFAGVRAAGVAAVGDHSPSTPPEGTLAAGGRRADPANRRSEPPLSSDSRERVPAWRSAGWPASLDQPRRDRAQAAGGRRDRELRVESRRVPTRALLLTDHYGWKVDPLVAVAHRRMRTRARSWDVQERVEDPHAPDALWTISASLQLARFATPSLWEALATGVVRQVVRASTARARYDRLLTAASAGAAFPSPESVLRCDARSMASLGLRFSWPTLSRLATWAIERGADDQHPSQEREALLEEATSVGGVGPWTVGVAAWDCTNDPARYPVGDYVVQLGARRLAPLVDWPRRPDLFAAAWRSHVGERAGELTVLALAAADDRLWRRLPALVLPEPLANAA